jgi:hypothetical protein
MPATSERTKALAMMGKVASAAKREPPTGLVILTTGVGGSTVMLTTAKVAESLAEATAVREYVPATRFSALMLNGAAGAALKSGSLKHKLAVATMIKIARLGAYSQA